MYYFLLEKMRFPVFSRWNNRRQRHLGIREEVYKQKTEPPHTFADKDELVHGGVYSTRLAIVLVAAEASPPHKKV